MIQIFSGNFAKVAVACSEAKQLYQGNCFESMGRDVGGRFRGDPGEAIHACSNAPGGASRLHCLTGAVQDSFWDRSGQDHALLFCKILKESAEKNICYGTIFTRAPQILSDKNDLQAFCSKVEGPFRKQCLISTGL
ncbi:MAG: hypothetical protein HY037_04475 [Nitrospirae bacterium]|nr:hypothetical protein [Candidatus Troglogloeales bacterium]